LRVMFVSEAHIAVIGGGDEFDTEGHGGHGRG